MASSYSSAQNQTIGVFRDPTAGFMQVSRLARELSKVLPKAKANPSTLMLAIASKTRIPANRIFGKILSSSPKGIKLFISGGRTSDQACHAAHLFYVSVDPKEIKIKSVRKIPNPFLRILAKKAEMEATQKKNLSSQTNSKRSTSSTTRDSSARTSRQSSRSVRSRGRRRTNSQMSSARVQKNIPTQVEVDLIEAEVAPTEEESIRAEPQDFSDMLQTANKSLYEENVPEETQPIVMPGTEQFMGLGIHVDRPSIICMTRPNTDLVTGGTVFDDLLAERFVRLENSFKFLEAIEEYEDYDTIKELYDLKLVQTNDILKVLEEVNNVELAIKATLRGDADKELSAFDYTREQNSTQAFMQAVWDLGRYPFIGSIAYPRVFDSENGHSRKLDTVGMSVKGLGSPWFSRDPIGLRVRSDKDPTGHRYYIKVGNTRFDFLQASGEINSDKFPAGSFIASFQNSGHNHRSGAYCSSSFGSTTARGGSRNTSAPHLCQILWTEMVLSKLVTAEHPAALHVKESKRTNFGSYFLNGVDLGKSIIGLEAPSGLTGVAKFTSSGQSYYPFEEAISSIKQSGSKVPITGKTFYGNILRPALGDVVEGREFNIDVVTEWMEYAGEQIGEFLDFTDLFTESGGGLLALNEITLAILHQMTDDDPFTHPISAVTQNLFDGNSWDVYYRHRLLRALVYCSNEKRATTMVFNTLAYNGAPWDIRDLAKATGHSFWPSHAERSAMTAAIRVLVTDAEDSDEDDIRVSPSDASEAVQFTNSIYSFLNSLFEQVEIGLTNSVAMLLTDKGLIEASDDVNYGSLLDGFFETNSDGIEVTTGMGIPRFQIRMMIWRVIWDLIKLPETVQGPTSTDDVEAFYAALAPIVVTNINPDDGPYRWGISRGAPLDNFSFLDNIDEEFFTDLVPQAVSEALTEGATDDDGDGIIQDDENPITSDWEFLQSDETYTPLTYILEGEDAGMDTQRVVFGNRGVWTSFVDDFIEYRTHGISYRNFLSSVVPPFENIPALLEGLAANDQTKVVTELAQFPGIEGTDVITFTGKVQDFNRRKDISVNKGQQAFSYMPAKYAKTATEYLCAKIVVQESLADFQRPETAKFHTVGIPCGLIENIGEAFEPISLKKYGTFAFFMDFEFSVVETMFQPNIYLVPGSLGECDPAEGTSGIIQAAQFLVIKESTQSFLSYSDTKAYLDEVINSSGASADAEEILLNHLISYSIQECIEIMNGMVLNESTFRYDKKLPNILIEPDVQKALPDLIKNLPDALPDYFEGIRVKTMAEILEIDPEISAAEVASLLVAFESRFLSAATIPASVLGVRMFDRVFHVITHPNQFEMVQSLRSGASELGLKEINEVMKIDMEDEPHGNKLYNDHIASYSFELEG